MTDVPPSVDGLAASAPPTPPPASPEQSDKERAAVRKWKGLLLLILAVLNVAYIGWCALLLMSLPSTNDTLRALVPFGLLSVAVGVGVLVIFAFVTLLHIASSKASATIKQRALIKLVLTVLPGLAISCAVPFVITQEPPLSISIESPLDTQNMVAPVQMTFGLQEPLRILGESGFRPIQYRWDINGDGTIDQQTLDPTLTATYDKDGLYTIRVLMIAANGVSHSASKRFLIQHSVFSVSPVVPIVEHPVVFSFTNLYPDPAQIVQVQWDFDGDGKVDETTKEAEVTNTFYRTGQFTVSALVDLANKTQAKYQRTIDVQNPPKLPFPIDLLTTPNNLIGTPPFTVLFSLKTDVDVAQVQWNFGDGERSDGTVQRIAHNYTHNGNFPVDVRVRSSSGVTADLSTVVRVVDALNIPDLTFDGDPQFSGNRIEGEVPLTLNLTPKTSIPFVVFSWEAPDATEVGKGNSNTLQAIYRKEGTYMITLVGQDVNNHVLRLPITVVVKPPAALVSFSVDPDTGVAPLTVNFNASDTSIPGDDPTGFTWNFGDGTPEITKGASITHEYTSPKTYNVNLRVDTVSGKNYSAARTVVVRAPVLKACFTRSRQDVKVGDPVQFDSSCTTGMPSTYLWDFGDGSQNDQPQPLHVFAQPGQYRVQLAIQDAGGSKSLYVMNISVTP